MNWILGFILILIAIYLTSIQFQKRKHQKIKKTLAENWGNSKQVNHFDFNLIERFFRNHNISKKIHQKISDNTWNDLDLNEIFKFLDRTTSKIGQQFLYSKLRTITTIEEVNRFHGLTSLLCADDILRLNFQVEFSKLSSTKAYYLEEIFRSNRVIKSSKIWLFLILSLGSILSIALSFFNPAWLLLLIPLFLINLVFHYKNKSSIEYYLNGVSQLSTAYQVANNIGSFKEINPFFPKLEFLKNVKSILSKIRFIEWEKKLDNEYALLFWFLSEIIKITFILEPILFYSFQRSLENKKDDIKSLYIFLGEIDAAISCASIHQTDLNICIPEFSDNKEVYSEGIYHPLIEKCIPNDFSLKNKSLLLTGSNMSGKTTFIRTFSINSILAQTINICFATKFITPFFKIFSSIRISDDLLNDTSYYLEEVVRIKELVDISEKKEPCLFVLDELFKGTNTLERIAAGKSILSYLNKGNNIVMVSTHDLELTDLLQKQNFDLYHFSESIEKNVLSFDHKIKKGKPKKGNAIKILELYNYPLEIIEEARKDEHVPSANPVKGFSQN